MDFLEIRRKAKARTEATRPPPAVPAEPAPEVRLEELPPPFGEELEPPLPPAPRWPGLSAEDLALVDALREDVPVAAASPPDPQAAEPAPEALAEPPPPAALPDAAPLPARREPAPDPDPLAEFFYEEGEVARELDGLAVPAPAAVPEEQPIREYLTFALGAEDYAVEIERVREVLKAPAITEVPRAPDHVLGVIIVRGEVIPVFDPRRRLGLVVETAGPVAPPCPPLAPEQASPAYASPRAPSPRILVCDAGEGTIGLLVDTVSSVLRLRSSDVEPRPQGIGGVSAEYISGIGRDRGRLVILLDLAAVLRGAAPREVRA